MQPSDKKDFVPIKLDCDTIHLWWSYPDSIIDTKILETQFLTLSAAEQHQQRRFALAKHRKQYLVSHALIRDVLSRYVPVAPRDWQFVSNPYGRPSVAAPHHDWLRFNLSHADGRVIVAVAREIDLGVDIENTAIKIDLQEIASRQFSSAEIAQLRQKPDLFLDFWTLKEAYIKATGLGLSIPLNSFSFDLTDPDHPRIKFSNGVSDRPERWWFMLRRAKDYRLSIAAASELLEEIRVIEHEVVPLIQHPMVNE